MAISWKGSRPSKTCPQKDILKKSTNFEGTMVTHSWENVLPQQASTIAITARRGLTKRFPQKHSFNYDKSKFFT